MTAPRIQLLDHMGNPMASAYEGSGAGMGGQLRDWRPSPRTIDASLLPDLELGNARAEDVVRNNAFGANAVQLHIDNIVGDHFRLSYKPNWQRLGVKENDMRAFAREVEQLWSEISEDPNCYLDIERKRTFTMMIREGISTHTRVGEIMRVPLWQKSYDSPINTAIKTINPMRVCNPGGTMDNDRIKGGVEQNRYGAAIAYHLRNPSTELGNGLGWQWERIPKYSRWGRQRFIHIFEPTGEGQSRGANQLLSVLEQMQILPKMQKTKMQNALVNAMFAATIETELGSQEAFDLLGGGADSKLLAKFLSSQMDYHDSIHLKLGGVNIPHLLPNERLNLQTSGNVDNGYVDLESSLLRWLAAGTNCSYEQLSKDYRQSSYSSARASMLESWRYFKGRRKIIAARDASLIFRLVFEELVHSRQITLPRGARLGLYDGLAPWTNCSWIGTGRLAIDGVKEVKEAILRIEAGLSTYEKELANMGEDYQEVFAQQVREMEERKEAGLPPPSWAQVQQFAPPEHPTEA